MIEVKVKKNDAEILSRCYYESTLTLEEALRKMEMYIVQEQLNIAGECTINARFTDAKASLK